MPLYEIGTGDNAQRVRTVAGSPEDDRLAADDSAKLVDETAESEPSPREQRRGRGTATVHVAGEGAS